MRRRIKFFEDRHELLQLIVNRMKILSNFRQNISSFDILIPATQRTEIFNFDFFEFDNFKLLSSVNPDGNRS